MITSTKKIIQEKVCVNNNKMSTIYRKIKTNLWKNLTKKGVGLGGVGWGGVGDHDTYHLEFMISFRTTEVSSDVGGIHTDSCCVMSNSSGK